MRGGGWRSVRGAVTSCVAAVILAGSAVASAAVRDPASACPSDVPEDGIGDVDAANVHEGAIDCLAHLDVAGIGRTDAYRHADPTTRAQMAEFVVGALRQAAVPLPVDPPDAFDDDDGRAEEQAINRLAAVGVVLGTAPRTYTPDAVVSRGQMTAFLVRAYDLTSESPPTAGGNAFTDDDGSVHERTINDAAALGIAVGIGDGTFRPADPVRRDQMASFTVRTLDAMIDDGPAPPVGARSGVLADLESWADFGAYGYDAAYQCGFKAATALQHRNPQLPVPSVTTADRIAVAVIGFNLGTGATSTHREAIVDHLAAAAALLRVYGFADYHGMQVFVTADRDELVRMYAAYLNITEDQARQTINATSDTNPGAVAPGALFLMTAAADPSDWNHAFISHEFFHMTQFQQSANHLIDAPDHRTPRGGPRWVLEGTAVAFHTASTAARSGTTATVPDMRSWLRLWDAVAAGDTWVVAFGDAWSVEAHEFYDEFELSGGC